MPQPTPVTRSGLPWVAVAVWGAILLAIVTISLAFAGRGAPANATAGANGAPANLLVPLAASPSPGASGGTTPGGGASGNDNGDRTGPGRGFRMFGPGGPGGKGGHGDGHGPHGQITITGISGTQLSLKTDDGWTRTIDAAGAAVREGDQTIPLGDLKVGDQIAFRQTRNSDGTFKITDIRRFPPHAAGVVKSVDATSATLTLPDGTTRTIVLTGSTAYTLMGKSATKDALRVGTRAFARGTVAADGTFTATKITIAPAVVIGQVTAKTDSSITVKSVRGDTVIINVDASTTYQARGSQSASLADVTVDGIIEADGAQNADGSLDASTVRILSGAKGGFFGPFRDGRGGRHPGHQKPAPNASPSGSTTSS